MELIKEFIDLFLHLDKHLAQIIQDYEGWTYLILFMIIFIETGVVIMPFLPGDSLLFAAGAFAATGDLNLLILIALLIVAAILGDTVNYIIGKFIGPKVFSRDYRFLKKKYLFQTQAFYEKHGGKTIIFARFIPIIRTFAPFVAGIGNMNYTRFISYNVFGGIVWVVLFCVAGYFFAEIPFVKNNFTLVILAIIVLSIMPPVFEFARHKYRNRKGTTTTQE